jgi:hypothetical protein
MKGRPVDIQKERSDINAEQTDEILEFKNRISRLVVNEYMERGEQLLNDKPDG